MSDHGLVLRALLESTMNLLEQATARRAEDDEQLAELRDAASILVFRVFFVVAMQRRGLLYEKPTRAGESLRDLVSAGDDAEHSPFLDLQDLTSAIRDGASVTGRRKQLAVAIKHASIFRNRPTDHFTPGLAAWLDGLDAATPKLANDAAGLREWDRMIARLEPLARGQVSRYELDAQQAEPIGGGNAHVQRVLGDVYEQILAMIPVRSGKGKTSKVQLTLTGKAAPSERRTLGAHYTPEALVTEVVLAALEPVFAAAWTRAGQRVDAYERELLGLRVLDPAMGSAHFLTVAALEIARELAWAQVYERPRDPVWFEVWPETYEPGVEHEPDPWSRVDAADRDALDRVAARRLQEVAQACCYGVDVKPLAVELGKLALWMLTMVERQARGVEQDSEPPPITFVDENLRCGDSLRGTDEAGVREFLSDVHGAELLDDHFDESSRWLWDLRFLYDWYGRSESALWEALTKAKGQGWLALLGGTGTPTKRQRLHRDRIRELAARLGAFHWPLEFPDVFHRELRGFDVIVTNPPFLGDRDLRKRFGEDGVAYLRTAFTSGATVDLAGFFVLAFDALLNERGVAGTVASNTLAQGKNRREVFKPLVAMAPVRFEIYRACASRVWPGDAAVHILTAHMRRPQASLRAEFRRVVESYDDDENRVGLVAMRVAEPISSYLDGGPETEMLELPGQADRIAFVGMFPRGEFDRPIEFLDGLPEHERAAVFAYLNNLDVQRQPEPVARRVIIDVADAIAAADLADSGSHEQETWLKTNLPTLYDELASTVKAERTSLPDSVRNKRARAFWWAFEELRPGLRAAWVGMSEVLSIGAVGKIVAPSIISRTDAALELPIVPTHQLFIIPSSSRAVFGLISSLVFEAFTRRACSSHETRLRFTPSEVFPYFPFPWPTTASDNPHRAAVLDVPAAVEAGLAPFARALLELRKDILVHPERHDLTRARVGGPTDLYNLFDDPTCEAPSIQRLRSVHHELERAVLRAYGWEDLHGPWSFERPWIDGTWRHVPPAAIRRAYLSRLAELNHELCERNKDR